MSVVTLVKPPPRTDLIEVIEAMKQAAIEGKIVAMTAAAVCADDCCMAYSGASTGVSRLRMQGALAQVLHAYLNGEVVEGDSDTL